MSGGEAQPANAPGRFVSRRSLLWITGALTLLTSIWLSNLDGALRTDAAPNGIVSFEFAGSAARADEMIASWGPEGRQAAALIQGLDYLYLVVYSSFLMLAGFALADRIRPDHPRLAALLAGFAAVMPVAGALDAVENFALIQLLQGAGSDFWARLAVGCALPKFGIVLGTLLMIILGGVLTLLKRSGTSASGE